MKILSSIFSVTNLFLYSLSVGGAEIKQNPDAAKQQLSTGREARILLDAAKKKLMQIDYLVVEISSGGTPNTAFTPGSELFLERPNKFRWENIKGLMAERRELSI